MMGLSIFLFKKITSDKARLVGVRWSQDVTDDGSNLEGGDTPWTLQNEQPPSFLAHSSSERLS